MEGPQVPGHARSVGGGIRHGQERIEVSGLARSPEPPGQLRFAMQAEILVHFLSGQMMEERSQADAGAGHRVGVVGEQYFHGGRSPCGRNVGQLLLNSLRIRR